MRNGTSHRLLVTSTLVLAFAATCSGSASQPKSTVTIDHRVQSVIQGFPGAVSLYAKNLETGATYELRADAPVPTASTIKLPIMVELFAEAQEGKLDWNQKLELTDQDKVSGTGVLTELSGGDLLPIRDLMHLMIVVSDNTATNLILDRIGGNAVNQRMAQLGLKQPPSCGKSCRRSRRASPARVESRGMIGGASAEVAPETWSSSWKNSIAVSWSANPLPRR